MQRPIIIRPEAAQDLHAIRAVNQAAFGRDTEADLVDKLRLTDTCIPELALVAVEPGSAGAGRVVGHLMMTKAGITSGAEATAALALGPMAVLPERQRSGIGSHLVRHALAEARALGHTLAIVLGHPKYYPRFGFVPASGYGIQCPFPAPDEAFMALWLSHPRRAEGEVRYAAPFNEID